MKRKMFALLSLLALASLVLAACGATPTSEELAEAMHVDGCQSIAWSPDLVNQLPKLGDTPCAAADLGTTVIEFEFYALESETYVEIRAANGSTEQFDGTITLGLANVSFQVPARGVLQESLRAEQFDSLQNWQDHDFTITANANGNCLQTATVDGTAMRQFYCNK